MGTTQHSEKRPKGWGGGPCSHSASLCSPLPQAAPVGPPRAEQLLPLGVAKAKGHFLKSEPGCALTTHHRGPGTADSMQQREPFRLPAQQEGRVDQKPPGRARRNC